MVSFSFCTGELARSLDCRSLRKDKQCWEKTEGNAIWIFAIKIVSKKVSSHFYEYRFIIFKVKRYMVSDIIKKKVLLFLYKGLTHNNRQDLWKTIIIYLKKTCKNHGKSLVISLLISFHHPTVKSLCLLRLDAEPRSPCLIPHYSNKLYVLISPPEYSLW